MSAPQAVQPRMPQSGCRRSKGPRLATVDVRIQAGRFTAIPRPQRRRGKSTLMSMLVGGARAAVGPGFWLDGLELSGYAVEGLARRRSVAPGIAAWPLTSLRPRRWWSWGAIRIVTSQAAGGADSGAGHGADRVDHLAQRSINTLSGGEKAGSPIWQGSADLAAACGRRGALVAAGRAHCRSRSGPISTTPCAYCAIGPGSRAQVCGGGDP